MPVNNCEINLILTWSYDFIISSAAGAAKLYVPVLTLSTQGTAKTIKTIKIRF